MSRNPRVQARRGRGGSPRPDLFLPVLLGLLLSCGSPLPPASVDTEAESSARPAENARPAGNARPAENARPAGTERMVRRLALVAENTPPMTNAFMNRERLEHLLALEIPDDPRGRARAELALADEFLRAGRSEEAVTGFRAVLETVRQDPSIHPPGLERRIRSMLAAAHLRVGEQQNCLEHHGIDSCLVPIRDTGVHHLQDGSRSAMAELVDLLREDGEDLMNRWLLNIAAMTVGEYPDGVPAEWRIPPAAFASEDDIGRFVDAAPRTGLDTVGLAGGSVVEDLDGDGYLDVMVSSWGLRDPLRFFRNRRDGTFEERTREAGLVGLVGGLNLIHADYDNDGDADVLVLRGAWMRDRGRHPNSLLENDGHGVFSDVTEQAGLLSFHPTQAAAWADFDNDGWLDLFIGNESSAQSKHPSELFKNNGADENGVVTFTEIAREAGVEAGGPVKGAAWGDYNNDGLPDLYLSRMRSPNLLFLNRGAEARPTFLEVGEKAGVDEPVDSFPTWFFDYDNDGWLDLFAGAYAQSFLEARAFQVVADYLGLPADEAFPRLYRNNRDGTFTNVTETVGLDHALLAMGANFGDLDSDGFPDIYVGTGAPDFRALVPNRMFRNAGGEVFRDVTASGGFGHLQKGHGVSFADLDGDGDQDVFAVMGGAFSGDVYQNALFLNPGHGHRFLTLRLEGTASNRSAIGARIRVELESPSGPRNVFATVSTGGSFGASSLQQEIGLGDALAIRAVEVQWPGGAAEIYRGLPLDRVVRLREGDPSPAVLKLEVLDFSGAAGS